MAHLDICLLYYGNKSRLACYDPLGSCFCCVAEMCGAQLGCLASCVNPLRQISIFYPPSSPFLPAARWGWYSVRVDGWVNGWTRRWVQAGIKRSILIQCCRDDLSDVIKVPSLTLGASSGTSHNMSQPGIFKLADLLALEVIALVYQDNLLHARAPVGSWCSFSLPGDDGGGGKERESKHSNAERWDLTFIIRGANLVSYQVTYPVLLYIRWPCGVKSALKTLYSGSLNGCVHQISLH